MVKRIILLSFFLTPVLLCSTACGSASPEMAAAMAGQVLKEAENLTAEGKKEEGAVFALSVAKLYPDNSRVQKIIS